MKKIFMMLTAASLMFMGGCTEEKQDPDAEQPSDTVFLSQETVSVDNSGGLAEVVVTSSGDWRMSGGAEWSVPSAVEGKSGDKITFEIAPNDGRSFYATEHPKFYQTEMGRKVVDTLHRIHITGLEKGTKYRYRIYSREVTVLENYFVQYGHTVASESYVREPLSFTTFDYSKPEISFTVVNDIHGDNELLADLIDNVQKEKNDFVIFNGDMVTTFDSGAGIFNGFLHTATERFASEIPFFYARGNHETRGLFFAQYRNFFPAPTQTTYYSFQAGPVFFIVLDGGEDKPDSDMEYFDLSAFDTFRNEQVAWLKKTLDSEACKNAAYRIVVIHIPPGCDTWYGPLESQRLFVPLLNEANIDLMLCGHLHRHVYSPAGEEGRNYPMLVNSNTEGAYITVNDKGIDLTVKDRQHNQTHNWKLPRK